MRDALAIAAGYYRAAQNAREGQRWLAIAEQWEALSWFYLLRWAAE